MKKNFIFILSTVLSFSCLATRQEQEQKMEKLLLQAARQDDVSTICRLAETIKFTEEFQVRLKEACQNINILNLIDKKQKSNIKTLLKLKLINPNFIYPILKNDNCDYDNNYEMIKLFLEFGADPNIIVHGKSHFDHAIDCYSEYIIDLKTLELIQSKTTLRTILDCRLENPKATKYDNLFPLSWWDFEFLCTDAIPFNKLTQLMKYRYQSLNTQPKYPKEKYIEIVIQLLKERGLIDIIVKSALDAGFYNPECLKHLVGHVTEDLNIRLQQILELQNIINSKDVEKFKFFISRIEKIEDLDKILNKNILNYFYEIDLFQFADHVVNKYYKSTSPTILSDHFKKSASRGILSLNLTIHTISKYDPKLTKLNDINQKGAIEAGLLGNINFLVYLSNSAVRKILEKNMGLSYIQIAAINNCPNAFLSLIPEIKHATKEFTEAAMALTRLNLYDLIELLNKRKYAVVFYELAKRCPSDSIDFRIVFNYLLNNFNYKENFSVLLEFKNSFLEQELEDILVSKFDRANVEIALGNPEYQVFLTYSIEKQKYKLFLKLLSEKRDVKHFIICKILEYKNIEAFKLIIDKHPSIFTEYLPMYLELFVKSEFLEGIKFTLDRLELNYTNLDTMLSSIFSLFDEEKTDDASAFKGIGNRSLYFSYLFLFENLREDFLKQYDCKKCITLIAEKKYYNFLYHFIEIMDNNFLLKLLAYSIHHHNFDLIQTIFLQNEIIINTYEEANTLNKLLKIAIKNKKIDLTNALMGVYKIARGDIAQPILMEVLKLSLESDFNDGIQKFITHLIELLGYSDNLALSIFENFDRKFAEKIAISISNYILKLENKEIATQIFDQFCDVLSQQGLYKVAAYLIETFKKEDFDPNGCILAALEDKNHELLKIVINCKNLNFSTVIPQLLNTLTTDLDQEFKHTLATILTQHTIDHIQKSPQGLTFVQHGLFPLLVHNKFYKLINSLIIKFDFDVNLCVLKAIQEHDHELLKSIIRSKKINYSIISEDLLKSLNPENQNDAQIIKLLKVFGGRKL